MEALRGHGGFVYAGAFSPSGRMAVTAGGLVARLWDTEHWRALLTLRGHDDSVLAAAFSPDGELVLTGSADQTARRWWSTHTGRLLQVLRGHAGVVYGVAFSPDGRRLATAGSDGTVRVLACEICGSVDEILVRGGHRVFRGFTAEERATYLHN